MNEPYEPFFYMGRRRSKYSTVQHPPLHTEKVHKVQTFILAAVRRDGKPSNEPPIYTGAKRLLTTMPNAEISQYGRRNTRLTRLTPGGTSA